jgi:hypothetical protein
VIFVLLALAVLFPPRSASAQFASLQEQEYSSNARLLEWIYGYRAKPKPARVPEAVHAMRRLGLFRDSEKSEFFVGFIAGVLGKNPSKARALVKRMFPMPPKEQAVIIKAIAYSGLEDWPAILSQFSSRMPHRQALIDKYLSGERKTLLHVPLSSGPSILYALWGYYVATGQYEPVVRVIEALQWSKGTDQPEGAFRRRVRAAFTWSDDPQDEINKATVGGTAKWTLVSHAERDRDLIDFYRVQLDYQNEETAPKLKDVIEAAEAFESERIRKEEFAAIDDIRRRNPEGAGFNRATTVGSVAIATGCVAATAAGQAAIAVPCIVTGAVYSGFVKLLRGAP